MSHLEIIRKKASDNIRKVLLPEAEKDIRVIKAAVILEEEKLAVPVLIGEKKKIIELADQHSTKIPASVEVRPVNSPEDEDEKFHFFKEKLAHKQPSDEQIRNMCENPLFTAGWFLQKGTADSAVAGSVASTSEVIIAAIRTVGVAEGSSLVSSSFLMELRDGRVFTYADCAVVPYPDSAQLASIALDAGNTHQKLTNSKPKIAFLSFSTKGSAKHDAVTLVQEAVNSAKKQKSDWIIDGEMQFDTAVVPEIAARKSPGSTLQGDANVFIFPNLDAGNIAYKVTERLAGATATGPILQGLGKPFLDLSRGCSVDDIVNTACVSILLSL